MDEIWKDVVGNEDYQVSSMGRVKSLKSNNERILNLTAGGTKGKEYFAVSLYKDNVQETRNVHCLVAESFLNHKPDGNKLVVDHINKDRLDNRMENLQIISHRQNLSKDKKSGSSKYVGVHWNKQKSRFKAEIQINGKMKHLGFFNDEEKASFAYQVALKKLS